MESGAPEDRARFLAVPDWQRRILDERLEDLDHIPADEQPWADVREELWPGAFTKRPRRISRMLRFGLVRREACRVDISDSIDGVPIRLTAERWLHIVENHDEMAGYLDEVLDTVADPEVVLPGYGGTLVAVRRYGSRRYLYVVYREVSKADGFIITEYFTRRLMRKKAIWKRS